MTAGGISQPTIRRGQLVFRLLFPLGVVLAVLAAPLTWVRRGGSLRNAYASTLRSNVTACAALAVLATVSKRSTSRGVEQPAFPPARPRLTRVAEDAVYVPDFPGTAQPWATPFAPGGEGRSFVYLTNRGRAWTYLLGTVPQLEHLSNDQLPEGFQYGNTDLWVLELVTAFRADTPHRWPQLSEPREWNGPPPVAKGMFVVFGDPQLAYGRASAIIKVTADQDQASNVAAGFAKVYGVSTCVARMLEHRQW